MEHTYTIRAADGQEYGPATLEELTGWAREGRIGEETELRRNDIEHFAAAASFTELQGLFAPPPLAAVPPPLSSTSATFPASEPAPAIDDPQLFAHLKSGASWFYWIAGLSLINSISATAGSDWRFIFGLGVTQVFDELGTHFGGSAKIVTLALDLLVAGLFICFGVFAHKRHLWAFIAGMVLFALDSLLLLLVSDWIGLALHAFVLFCFFRGMKACRALNAT